MVLPGHPIVLQSLCAFIIALVTLGQTHAQSNSPTAHWPQWRGPFNTGTSSDASPPLKWSDQDGIRWKLPLEAPCHSTPIAWGEHVYLLSADPIGEPFAPRMADAPGAHDNLAVTHTHAFSVSAIRRDSGKVSWRRVAVQAIPHEGGHTTGSLAAASPVTDGKRIYAYFGSQGLYAYDMNGMQIWKVDLGTMQSRHAHGEGASPALHDDTLVVNWDHEAQSYIAAFDARTGKQRWKTLREVNTSWSSPLIISDVSPTQVVVAATGRVRSYDLSTGKELWSCDGLSRNVVASPLYGHGLVFAANSYDWQALLAIRIQGASGDLTDTDHLVWSTRRLTPYVPSPLLYDGVLYFLRHNQNILTALNARTGTEVHGSLRLPMLHDIFASPVAADGRIYIAGRRGTTVVLSSASPPEVLAVNRLSDAFSASPALIGKELYLRGEKFLYCIDGSQQP